MVPRMILPQPVFKVNVWVVSVKVSARNVCPSLAEFSCDDGHTLVGSSVLMCMLDGTWNDTAPTCIQGKENIKDKQ